MPLDVEACLVLLDTIKSQWNHSCCIRSNQCCYWCL